MTTQRCHLCAPSGVACDRCVARSVGAQGDTVRSEGRAWGLRVSWRAPEDPSLWPSWPAFDESPRAQGIAQRLISTLAGGDPRIAAAFARICHAAAAEQYELERNKRSGVA